MSDSDYKNAYQRQKQARKRAETLLEERSRELYAANETLKNAYDTLKNQKAQLVQQEKLASIGLLAAGIAHEINNPVGFVKSNLETLQGYLESISTVLKAYQEFQASVEGSAAGAELAAQTTALTELCQTHDLAFITEDSGNSIRESLAGARRIEDIVVNLKDFARTDSDERELCAINEVVENTLKLVRNQAKYQCEIIREFSDTPRVYGCVGQLNQVFVNIIMNALQAMDAKGSITIRTRHDEEMVYVDFIDSGPGIDQAHLTKLFDPFFTTKGVGAGTGLGLYVSHGLVQKHRGSIEAANEPMGGARFTVSLPLDMRRSHQR